MVRYLGVEPNPPRVCGTITPGSWGVRIKVGSDHGGSGPGWFRTPAVFRMVGAGENERKRFKLKEKVFFFFFTSKDEKIGKKTGRS